MGIADLLMFNVDRNPGNWIQLPGGRLAGIDHGNAFYGGGTHSLESSASFFRGEFAEFATNPMEGTLLDTIDFGPVDLGAIRERVSALRPEFERLGRMSWFDGMMDRMGELEKRAR
jgi:hypothetical protein